MVTFKYQGLLASAVAATPAFAVLLASGAALAASPRPSVIAFNQPVENNAVDITYANLPRDGYLVVLGSDAHGMPSGATMGAIQLPAGDHRDVKVTLTETAKPGQKLWASLYDESDGKPVFNAKADKPFWAGKLPEQNAFSIK